jgi:hypothetical protein
MKIKKSKPMEKQKQNKMGPYYDTNLYLSKWHTSTSSFPWASLER